MHLLSKEIWLFLLVEMSAHPMIKKPYTCSNCGSVGHSLRVCQEPIMSFGIIAFRVVDQKGHLESTLCSEREDYLGMARAGKIQFLLIQRKDSLAFVEFVRGKYTLEDPTYLRVLFENMTIKEREYLLKCNNFDDLWQSVWGEIPTKTHKHDYENSKTKYGQLRTGDMISIEGLIADTKSEHLEPEWGFPKGRRNPGEEDIQTAVRECWEETGLTRNQLTIIKNLCPLEETFFGSNRVHYCHKYYMAYCRSDQRVSLDTSNPHMRREIGDVGWFSLEEALERIWPENVEKREVVLRAQALLRNFMPINTQYFQNQQS
jgi:8-oxo-dGTP pyrophosphatase MutT (NUDIX family)